MMVYGSDDTLPAIWAVMMRNAARYAGLITFGARPADVSARVGGLVYLASPYSKLVCDRAGGWDYRLSYDAQRAPAVECLHLMRLGVTAVSPIVQSVELIHASMTGIAPVPTIDPLDAGLWQPWCNRLLDAARAVVVPDIRGWSESVGVMAEVQRAMARLTPVFVYANAVPGIVVYE